MTRKKARHLLQEMARRMYEKEHGSLQGFGKIAKHYGSNWRPNFTEARRWGCSSYVECWNNETVKTLRKSVGM